MQNACASSLVSGPGRTQMWLSSTQSPLFAWLYGVRVGAHTHSEASTLVLHMAQGLCASSQLAWSSAVFQVREFHKGLSFLREANNVILLSNKKERILLHTATGVSLRNIMLSKGSQIQKSMITFVRSFDWSVGIDTGSVIAFEEWGYLKGQEEVSRTMGMHSALIAVVVTGCIHLSNQIIHVWFIVYKFYFNKKYIISLPERFGPVS